MHFWDSSCGNVTAVEQSLTLVLLRVSVTWRYDAAPIPRKLYNCGINQEAGPRGRGGKIYSYRTDLFAAVPFNRMELENNFCWRFLKMIRLYKMPPCFQGQAVYFPLLAIYTRGSILWVYFVGLFCGSILWVYFVGLFCGSILVVVHNIIWYIQFNNQALPYRNFITGAPSIYTYYSPNPCPHDAPHDAPS